MAYDDYVMSSLGRAVEIATAMQYCNLIPVSVPINVQTIRDIDSKHNGTCLERLKYLSDTGAFEMCTSLLNKILSNHVDENGSDNEEDDDDYFHGGDIRAPPPSPHGSCDGSGCQHGDTRDTNHGPIVSAPPPSPRNGDEDHALNGSIGTGSVGGSVNVTLIGPSEEEKCVRQKSPKRRRS